MIRCQAPDAVTSATSAPASPVAVRRDHGGRSWPRLRTAAPRRPVRATETTWSGGTPAAATRY